MSDQLSSRALALAVVGANLAVCAAVITLFMVTGGKSRPVESAGLEPSTIVTVTEASTQTTVPAEQPAAPVAPGTTEADPADQYQRVDGADGMSTVVPAGWPSAPAAGQGSAQATDPDDGYRFVRYGGSPAPAQDSYSVHVAYQRDFAKSHNGFQSVRLNTTDVRGATAVDWEFEWDAPEGRRHVRSIYWRAQGDEYFVYASSLVGRWPSTEPILDVMLARATP
jgi:hypothetical protein